MCYDDVSASLYVRIEALSDREAIAVLKVVGDELLNPAQAPTEVAQKEALRALLEQEKQEIELTDTAQADAAKVAEAARVLLKGMARAPETRGTVRDLLDNLPGEEHGVIPLILAVPIVFSACVAFMQVVGHTEFQRLPDGKWSVHYNPNNKNAFDDTLKETVKTLGTLMGKLPGK